MMPDDPAGAEELDRASNWIFVWEITSDGRLVDDHYRLGPISVGLGEEPSGEERRPQHAKVVGRDLH